MTTPYIFRFVGDSLANLSSNFIESASSGIIAAFTPVALASITLFITVYGYMVIAGKVSDPLPDLIVKLVKFALICGFALNAGNYTTYVVGALQGLESGLISAIGQNGGNAESTYQLLDQSIGQAADLAGQAMEKFSEKRFYDMAGWVPWLLTAFFIYAGMTLYFMVGGAMLVMAKFALGLVFGVGPLFVLSLLFPATAGFFDRWLSQVLTYIFTIVLLAAVLTMGITIFNHLIVNTVYDDESNAAFIGLQILIVSGVLGFITMQVAGIASGLAGGAGLAALSMRQLMSPITNTARSAAAAINPTSNRLDPRSGLQTSSSRAEHFAMGRSIMSPNPAYRQALQERLRNSFSYGGNTIRKSR